MSRSTCTSGNSRVLLRTATAALSTLSFLVFGTSPTAQANAGVDRVRPSGPDSPHRVRTTEAHPQKHFPAPWSAERADAPIAVNSAM
ncbi:hypothetical protein ABT115_30320 [Streptomyces sp. NPDC001832]|uniref:hypothetical protein n=1 Tax=Streptomyces sp. NPDC001832 TaxID=3154527 RepID=UPI0033332993